MNLIYFFLIISIAINLFTAVIIVAIFRQAKPVKKPVENKAGYNDFSVGDKILWNWIEGPSRGYYTIKEIFKNSNSIHISLTELDGSFDIKGLIDRRNLRKYTK